jgi:DNA polymerase-1
MYEITVIDIETTGFEYDADILGVAYRTCGGQTGFLTPKCQNFVQDIQDVCQGRLLFHNAYFDVPRLERLGIEIEDFHDTMIMSYCLKPEDKHSLDYWGERLVFEKLDYNHDEYDEDKLRKYAIRDVELTYKLYEHLVSQFKSNKKLEQLYLNVELPVVRELIEMYKNGIYIDQISAHKLGDTLQETIDGLMVEFEQYCPHVPGKHKTFKTKPAFTEVLEFNPNSNDHKAYVLQKLGWVPTEKTKSGKIKLDKNTLEYTANYHHIDNVKDFAGLCLEYAKINKILNTFVKAITTELDGNILRGELKQTGTITGRLSSKNPNLQNLPVRTELGQAVRKCIVPKQGHILLDFDLSNIEGRVLAHYLKVTANDDTFTRIYESGEDLHDSNAKLWHMSRDDAKTTLYALLYGASEAKLGNGDAKKGRELLHKVQQYMPSIFTLKELFWSTLQSRPEHEFYTAFGRRLSYPDIVNPTRWIKEKAKRQSFNALLQGTAADIMKIIIGELLPKLRELGAIIHAQVHDEILMTISLDKQDEVIYTIDRYFKERTFLECPVECDINIGNNWAEVH